MILVIGNEDDISTDYFMEWCHYLGIAVTRLNEDWADNLTESIYLDKDNLDIVFDTGATPLRLSSIDAVWFRRGHLWHGSPTQDSNSFTGKDKERLQAYLENESTTLNDFVLFCLRQKKCLNDPAHYNANKLLALYKARAAGLNIPQTLITTSLQDIDRYYPAGTPLITKALQDAYKITLEGLVFSPVIHHLKRNDNTIPGHFYYSKFQQAITPKYELRIFFIEDRFYAGAIFPAPEGDEAGSGRVVPFQLPEPVQEKLKLFNRSMQCNSGSIDMIVDHEDRFYFLEINPVGQYDFLSKHCNYYLDREIALHLKQTI